MARKILVIDDEAYNLEIIEGFLKLGENSDHDLILCKNGKMGYEALSESYRDIDVILLDRMMPGMSGIDFFKKIKEEKKLNKIPVIIQTASNQKEDLIEGFKLGVYHYLVKPYSPVVLNSIVKSAIELYTKKRLLTSELNNAKTLLKYVNSAIFTIKDLEDANVMSISLARLFPSPDKVVLGISEMLVNAIEHGNLGITYDDKTKLNNSGQWKDEVNQRLESSQHKDKLVMISYFKNKNEIVLNIKDQGSGFDFEKYLHFDPNRSSESHGRGIAFASNLSFDRLEYIGSGNEVNCAVRIQ